MSDQQNDFFDGLLDKKSGNWFNFGVNHHVHIKSMEVVEKEGLLNSIKVVFTKKTQDLKEGEKESVVNWFINLPKPKMGETEVSREAVGFFLNTIKDFFGMFSDEDAVKSRMREAIVQVSTPLNVTKLQYSDIKILYLQLKGVYDGLVALVKDKVFTTEGTLVCGYNKGGYLTPHNYGEGGIYHSPFYVGKVDAKIPVESSNFLHTRPNKDAVDSPKENTNPSSIAW